MRRLVVVLLGIVLLSFPVPGRAGAAPTSATLSAALSATSTPGRSGETTSVTWVLTDDVVGSAGRTLLVERRAASGWERVGEVVTGADGRAVVPVELAREPARNLVRATVTTDAGPVSSEHSVGLLRWGSTVKVSAPRKVVDERRTTVTATWVAANGEPVRGHVRLQRKVRRPQGWTKKWRTVAQRRTDARGRATFTQRPRRTVRWRVRAAAPAAWVAGDVSGVTRTRNLPPGTPVALPKGAPRPRVTLPQQRRAVGEGANVVVRRIPKKVWRSMVGRSWHRGCPVGRAGLRLVEVNYWGFDGYRRRGQMVVAASVTSNFAGAFTEMYQRRVPVRSMYRVDRFGWSRRLGGADDHRSMAADNTSVFNCRGVVGNPSVRSPHSYGRSLDLNPWENPYFSRTGVVPNRWWVGRSHPRVAWRSRSHPVVQLLARHGFRWTYGTSDAHHFDAVAGAGGRRLRALLESPPCVDEVCH